MTSFFGSSARRSRSVGSSWPISTGSWLTNRRRSAVTVTVSPLASSTTCCAFGRLTVAADSTIADVVIMKIISSTRNTSVSGVMLISAMIESPESSSEILPSAMHASRVLEGERRRRRFDEAAEPDTKLGIEVADLDLEVVEEQQCEDRDQKPERGCDQRFGDAGGHDCETAGAHHGHLVERLDDADHRAE